MTANLKTSFYKTLEERLLAHAVDSDFNSLFGDGYYYLEPKHIRFMGRDRVTEIVNHRVDYRLSKDNSVGVVLK